MAYVPLPRSVANGPPNFGSSVCMYVYNAFDPSLFGFGRFFAAVLVGLFFSILQSICVYIIYLFGEVVVIISFQTIQSLLASRIRFHCHKGEAGMFEKIA